MLSAGVGAPQIHSVPCRQPFGPATCAKIQARKVRCYSENSDNKPSTDTKFRGLQSTQEERDQRPGKHEILNVAEHDLEGFCSALPDDEESEECWNAYQYYEDKRHEAEEACEVEWENNDGLTQPQCARLEQFEGFVREMVGEGHIVNFITTLQSLSKADQRRLAKELEASGDSAQHDQGVREAAQKVQESLDTSTSSVGSSDQETSQRRARVKDLFYAMDTDNNGKLDVGEFREAMRELGDEMSGSSVATILDAMDVHGYISLDQFVAIVEAEAIESHSSDAKMLRRLSKDPVWWTRST
ncbi:TPA: hypothetical protein ACH3X2_013235 [Trebouxia sp. C0005]